MIRRSSASDLDAVLAINDVSRPGVARLDLAEIERLLGLGALLSVAENEGVVTGYLLAFRYGAAYDGEEFRYFQRHLAEKFLYVDQVAIDPRARRRGVGTALYRSLLSASALLGTICCEVNLDPSNPESMAFHRQLGFTAVSELKLRDGRTVALLRRDAEILQQ